jgi:hypothetical protein
VLEDAEHADKDVLPAGEVWPEGHAVQEVAPLPE